MTIKELFELAIEHEQIDVQALIMFLVFEKQVHTMDEDARVLDLYFSKKHRERMNEELTEFKKKITKGKQELSGSVGIYSGRNTCTFTDRLRE